MNPLFDQDVNPLMRRLQDSYEPALTQARLAQVAGELGIRWPADFAEFLLCFNGGYFAHPVGYDVLAPAEYVSGGTVQSFLGIFPGAPEYEEDMRRAAYRLEDGIPETMLPIACCWSDWLLLAVRGRDYGKIYHWDFAEGGPEDIHLVAYGFSQFIAGLKPEADHEKPQERLPAFRAVAAGEEAAVHSYLADGGAVDLRNARGETLLMCAAQWSWPRLVKRLLAAGAAANAHDTQGQTPMYFAMRGQSSDSIKLLAAAGADLNYRDSTGHCLVQRAREFAFWSQAHTLVQLGAPKQ
jgi:hypothetical protein